MQLGELGEACAGYTVLGASGFIGRRIVKTLRGQGEICYAPAKDSEEIFERDLGCVFYCIGLTNDYALRPFDTVNAHVSFLAKILAEAKFDRLVYLSSTRLYDGQRSGDEQDSLLLNPANPRHLYDLSKALGENLCLMNSDGRAGVARLSSVYDESSDAPGFLSELLVKLKTKQEFVLDSSLNLSRDYIHLDDVVTGLKAILDKKISGIVNVASGENVSNQQLMTLLNDFGYRISFARPDTIEHSVTCNVSRLSDLGIQPVLALDYLKYFMERLHGHGVT